MLKYILAISVTERQCGFAKRASIYMKLITVMFLLMIDTFNFYVCCVNRCMQVSRESRREFWIPDDCQLFDVGTGDRIHIL